jgi:hypothetical protein
MTAENLIYDIKEIVAATEDDSDLDEYWLIQKINNYRAVLIAEQFRVDPVVDPSWLQRIGKFKFTKSDAADDPLITVNSITLGRYILPSVISLPDDLGLNRISGSSGIVGFEPTDFDTLVMKALVKEEISPNYGYYARIGRFAYVYPYIMEGSAIIIAENPFDVPIYTGTEYRTMTMEDHYPIDARMAQLVIVQILTNDLNISQQSITDIVNDSQSQLKVLKNGNQAAVQKKD